MEQFKTTSKFLSLILRHKPETIGIQLDENGWANVDELISKINANGKELDFESLENIVLTNDKQRFSFNDDLTMIRANQGHSIEVDLALEPALPPEKLYHGTVAKFLEAIKENGLQKMSRQHVHLSHDISTAQKVGSRRGKPVILTILANEMKEEGFTFFLSENGVWLCDHVPSKFILFP
jgi:putative RNA 2'-phosphotransferase